MARLDRARTAALPQQRSGTVPRRQGPPTQGEVGRFSSSACSRSTSFRPLQALVEVGEVSLNPALHIHLDADPISPKEGLVVQRLGASRSDVDVRHFALQHDTNTSLAKLRAETRVALGDEVRAIEALPELGDSDRSLKATGTHGRKQRGS